MRLTQPASASSRAEISAEAGCITVREYVGVAAGSIT